jgi:D-specific alpha-keto acid dehydrogenase
VTAFGCDDAESDLFHLLGARFGLRPTTTSEPVSSARLASLPANRCASVGHTAVVTARELQALRDAGVEYLCTRSVGTDHIDLHAAAELGIAVDNVRYAPDGVADFTLMLILMALRAPGHLHRSIEGNVGPAIEDPGRDLRDLVVGVVGTGPIGQAVIQRLAGFGCRVLTSRSRSGAPAGAAALPLDELLAASDVVTLHLPHTPSTHHLVGDRELRLMRPDAILVNTARGGLVDTAALVRALGEGRLGAAALDVVEGEHELRSARLDAARPPELLVRLHALPNVIVTPHVAYRTTRALREIVGATLANCLEFERSHAHGDDDRRCRVRRDLGGT